METPPTVYIVDDDESVRHSLRLLIESAQFAVRTFASGEEFLQQYEPASPGCLILDIRMNGMSGLEVQQKLMDTGIDIPVIVMTGHADVAACRTAFKLGALEFMEKPADEKVLIESIRRALAEDAKNRLRDPAGDVRVDRLAGLSSRESQVVELIVQGKSQKQIALQLSISIQTVAKLRARALVKLGVNNDVELTRLILRHGP